MQTKSVTVKFGGDLEGVSVDTFTQVVLNYARVLQLAAAETDPNVKIDVKITATRPGCLEAILQTAVTSLPGLLATLSQVSDQLTPIIDNVNGYLKLRQFLGKKGAPKSVESSGSGITIVTGDNSTINVTNNVYRLGTSDPVDSAAEMMFSALEGDDSIASISIGSEGTEGFEAPSADFPTIKTAPQCVVGDERVKIEEKVYLSVTKPMLEVSDKRKWEFYWNGQKATGYVSDFEFLNKLVSHEYTFGIGDDILADLELTQKRNAMNVWENKRIRVIKVYDVIAQPKRRKLF
ncbi:hypothetical protein [Enorma phocaeensis]|uniref:hypothetical protein n=1 Tax=Enorma phocaeensis TaxID=1871019 RepID=UPI000C83BEE7|nr:hypothetical protein [Enorma phocaeensis]